jgi:hypothetical protein
MAGWLPYSLPAKVLPVPEAEEKTVFHSLKHLPSIWKSPSYLLNIRPGRRSTLFDNERNMWDSNSNRVIDALTWKQSKQANLLLLFIELSIGVRRIGGHDAQGSKSSSSMEWIVKRWDAMGIQFFHQAAKIRWSLEASHEMQVQGFQAIRYLYMCCLCNLANRNGADTRVLSNT